MPDKNLPIFNCPVCARSSLEHENNRRVARSHSNSAIKRFRRNLFHYRTCHHCGIVFKVAKLETYLYKVIPANLWRLVDSSVPNSNWVNYPTNPDHNANYLSINQEIRPACSKNLPKPIQYLRSRQNHANERPFQMEINCSEFGFHFAMIFDGIKDSQKIWRLIGAIGELILAVANNFITFLKAVFIDPLPNQKTYVNTNESKAIEITKSQKSLIITEIYNNTHKAAANVEEIKNSLTGNLQPIRVERQNKQLIIEEIKTDGTSQTFSPTDPLQKNRNKTLILPEL